MSNIALATVLYISSILLNSALGFFVFLRGKKEKINRLFFTLTLFVSGWLISLFLFYKIESPTMVLWLGRLNFAIVFPLCESNTTP